MTGLWLQHARSNAVAMAPTAHHERSTVWVWLGWFVPVVNFWFPYQVVRDVRSAVAPDRTGGLLGAWWGLWLGYMLVTQVGTRISTGDELDRISWLGSVEAVNGVLAVAACACWVRLVREITGDQQAVIEGGAPRRY